VRAGFFSGEERAFDQFGSRKGEGKTCTFTHYQRRRNLFLKILLAKEPDVGFISGKA
jgi:hypothetical protein